MSIRERHFQDVYINGKYAGHFAKHRFAWMNTIHEWYLEKAVPFIKKLLLISTVAVALAIIVGAGMERIEKNLYPELADTTYVKADEEEVEGAVVPKRPAILAKIAKCESGDSHYDKNGQVLINPTKDAGRYQINVPIHGKKATELGFNLMNEKDNELFALYLFENYGSEPWVHSKTCWKK